MNADRTEAMDTSETIVIEGPRITRNGATDSSSMETRVCVVGKKSAENQELLDALKVLDLQVTFSDNGTDELQLTNDEVEVVFVCDPFEGEDFEALRREEQRILGPPIVITCAKHQQPLPCNSRPLFCSIMTNHIICFTGFRKKEQLGKFCNLVHNMGGSIRREFSGRVTQLVASSVHGQKYRTAVSLGTPIMTEEWIHTCWEKRRDLTVGASDKEMMKFKMMPFCGCFLNFYGFSDDERKQMEDSTEQQGGAHVEASDSTCTHIVVEDSVTELPKGLVTEESTCYVVKQEWFWASIHMDACADESLYTFRSSSQTELTQQQKTPVGGRKRKRRRLKDSDLSDLLSPDSPLFQNKRRSKDALSLSTSLLDCSLVSPATPNGITPGGSMTPKTPMVPVAPPKPVTARHQVALELLQTEKNYVEILSTILKVFKEPLEPENGPRGGPIIPSEDIKTIFGSLPEILQVHTKIMAELDQLISSWSEEKCIGDIILRRADELVKVYPPFVNYFEMSKETVSRCNRENPRFYAFLKACLSKPECGRQNLAELLIRPVQRLPSMNLLLTDLLKRTDKNNPDHSALVKAVEALKDVMLHINEDKRKTEGQVQMFEILRDVDGCPAYILSSHRSYVMRADTYELSDGLVGKGEAITLFLFSDSLEIVSKFWAQLRYSHYGEITKRRCAKVTNKNLPLKSPAAKTPQKAYKHIEFMPLSHIRRVVDIRDTEDYQNLFGLIYRCPLDMKEKLVMFRMVGEESSKEDWLRKMTAGLASAACMADTENFLTKVDPQELMLSKSDLSTGTLSRAVRVAKKTTRKVSRALSMNRTPRRLGLLRRSNSNITPSRLPLGTSPLVPSGRQNSASSGGMRTRTMSTMSLASEAMMSDHSSPTFSCPNS